VHIRENKFEIEYAHKKDSNFFNNQDFQTDFENFTLDIPVKENNQSISGTNWQENLKVIKRLVKNMQFSSNVTTYSRNSTTLKPVVEVHIEEKSMSFMSNSFSFVKNPYIASKSDKRIKKNFD
jgi:hypothetical protein